MPKRRELDIDTTVTTPEQPYSEELAAVAESVLGNEIPPTDSPLLNNPQIESIEKAGRVAMATLLKMASKGELPDKLMFDFLKALAERKTPAPAVRVEEHQIIDMKLLIAEAIEVSPDRFNEIMARAAIERQGIKDRLKLGSDMKIQPKSMLTEETGEYPEWARQGEPDEILNLRGEKDEL